MHYLYFFVAHCVESPQKLAHRISSTSLCTSTIIIKTLWICNCYSMRPLHQTTEGQKQRETGMGRGRNKVQNSYFSLSSDASVIWNARFRFFEVASSSRLFFFIFCLIFGIWCFLHLKHMQSWKCCKTLKNNRIYAKFWGEIFTHLPKKLTKYPKIRFWVTDLSLMHTFDITRLTVTIFLVLGFRI